MHRPKFEKLNKVIQMNLKMLSLKLLIATKNPCTHPQLNKHKKNWLHNLMLKFNNFLTTKC
jgi:hypothetical protein